MNAGTSRAPFALPNFVVDLTLQAAAGRLDPVVGREQEIRRVVRILCRKTKNNPVLLGEPGVGKTAIVEGLAQAVAAGAVPAVLAGASVLAVNVGNLLAGTGCRGDFEQRLQALVTQLQRPGGRRLLFIDELHLLGRAGRSEGGIDAANLLKPLLARGQLPCIGASTRAEWGALVELDPALERRFQPVDVAEPSAEQAVAILRGLRARYEQHHGVEITDQALHAAVECSGTTVPCRCLPDRAVDLLDEACAMLRLERDARTDPRLHATQRALDDAKRRFDLRAYARLRYRVLPALGAGARPRLEATHIATLAPVARPDPLAAVRS